jgi:16S rRNA (uracil1498-N3)-methyltransferase
MPATPAWPPASTPRLFVDQPLGPDATILLDGAAAHYLTGVMRLKPGAPVKLFDDVTGEWLALVRDVAKRSVTLAISEHLRVREDVPDLWLLAAPIKKARIDWVAEKACELGVARIVPVITRRTVVDRLNPDRLRAHMIEAAEQCGRTALTELGELTKLETLLRDWPAERVLYFADENGGGALGEVVRTGPAAILIGPEGGFTEEERAAIRALPNAVPISLGPRILRADTAVVAAISLWMAAAGDWRASSEPG